MNPEQTARMVDALNTLWTTERALIDQYVARSKVCESRGHGDLADRFSRFSFTEMREVSALLDRIVELGGMPQIRQVAPVEVGEAPEEQLRLSLEAERGTVARLEQTIAVCDEVGDADTRALIVEDLERELEHVAWLEERLKNPTRETLRDSTKGVARRSN